jgi:Fe-S cluster assembly iron-binding protein IscA
MLKLSHDAAKILNDAKSEAQVPGNYGLRIFSEPGVDGSNLAIAFAEGPEQDDEVSEQEGLPVFVARDVAEPLDEAVLDIEKTDTGVALVIKMDEDAGEMPADPAVEKDGDLPNDAQHLLND